MSFYAVKKGRQPGIYRTWKECKIQTNKFTGAQFKRFDTETEALSFIQPPHFSSTFQSSSVKSSPSSAMIQVFTDGSCFGNPGMCSAAAILVQPDGKETFKVESLGYGTNNIGELQAILLGLELIEECKIPNIRFLLLSDSQYAINMVENLWKPKTNFVLIDKVKNKLSLLRQSVQVQFEWVKGHASNVYNEKVDQLAKSVLS